MILQRIFFDDSHLNVYGAEKFTKYFVESTEYFAGKVRNDSDWQDEWEEYTAVKNN